MFSADPPKGRYGPLLFLAAVIFCCSPLYASGPAPTGETFAAVLANKQVTLTGYTRARRFMEIVSEEAGRCVKVLADVGEKVGADGVFAKLDTTFVDLALKQNRVSRDRLKNQIAYYDKDVRRYLELVGRAAAAQTTLDKLRNQTDQARFQLQALEVERQKLEEQRRRLTIKVPFGWTIINRSAEPGAWVAVGQTVGRAGDYRTLLIPFSVSAEEYRALLRQRESLTLAFPDEDLSEAAVPAVLELISPAFDSQTRKIDVDLAVRGGLGQLRGGLRAELTLDLPDPSGAILVPASALVQRYEEYWLVRETGERVRVAYLGKGPNGTDRIRSSQVKPGDRFQLTPKW